MQIKHRSQLNEVLNHFNMLGDSAEVGVAEGRYSAEILSWGIPKLYLVDIWESKPFFGDASSPQEWHDKNLRVTKESVKDYLDKVVFLKGLSIEMANQIPDESLCFVYLDACHTYEAVLGDLNAYLPKLKQDGIMAGHDFLCKDYGVEQAVHEFCQQRNYEVNTIPELSIENASFWFQKK